MVQIKEIPIKVDYNVITTRSRLATKKLVRKDMEVNPFTNAIDMLLEYSKLLKDLITKKVSLKDYGAMTFEEDCSVILENPKKLGYPNSYTTPISIGSLSVGREFPDLGSSINLISLSLLNKIGKVAMNQHA